MTSRFEHGYALLIGVDQSQVARWALPEVAQDIEALADVLVHPERCAYPTSNVKVLVGRDATRNGILDGLAWLEARIAADTAPPGSGNNATAVVYYTGHGWRNTASDRDAFYLVPYDIREGQIELRGLRAADFTRAVGALSPRRLLVILDCCRAGGMGVKEAEEPPLPGRYVSTAIPASLLMGEQEDAALGPEGAAAKGLELLGEGRGRAVFCSSSGEQSSYLRRDRTMSIFTYHLIEALTGHAQPKVGAEEVLVTDVMSYLWREVPRSARADWGKDQTPDCKTTGMFPVALLLGGKGLSKGQPAPDPLEPLPEVTPAVSYRAELHGSGAVAQGPGAVAAGERGVAIGGDASGPIITGDGNVIGDHSSGRVQKGGTHAGEQPVRDPDRDAA